MQTSIYLERVTGAKRRATEGWRLVEEMQDEVIQAEAASEGVQHVARCGTKGQVHKGEEQRRIGRDADSPPDLE
jgi:hypothetical protein